MTDGFLEGHKVRARFRTSDPVISEELVNHSVIVSYGWFLIHLERANALALAPGRSQTAVRAVSGRQAGENPPIDQSLAISRGEGLVPAG